MGRNVLLCLKRYRCTFNDFLSSHSFKHIICRSVSVGCRVVQYTVCSMSSECLRVRDGLLKLPDCFSQSDINDIIKYLSRFYVRLFCVGFYVLLYVYIFIFLCMLLLCLGLLCTSCTIFIINI